jgi:hypothetical protein
MIHSNEPRRAGGAAGLSETSLLGGFDDLSSSKIPASAQANPIPSAEISKAKIEILLDDLTDTCGWMVSQLHCLPEQRAAGDVDGVIHTLRMARGYWRVIAPESLLLVEARDDLLSALRQEDQR